MLHPSAGVGSTFVSMGPVQVRLTGVARTDGDGKALPSVTAPTVAEASSALDRMARVVGADAVLKPSTDYRAAAMAAGPLGCQTHVVVTAWGIAVKYDQPQPPPKPEDGEPPA